MRHGLTIGINYGGSDHELSGCLADSAAWRARMKDFDSAVPLDEQASVKAGIIESFKLQLEKSKAGDVVVATYSGHGTIVPPGIQAIVPYDFDWDDSDTWLTYDEIDHLLMEHEAKGVRVVLIFDSCHSAADPRLHMRTRNAFIHAPKTRFLAPPPEMLKRTRGMPFDRNVITSDMDDVLLAGCAREQTSADAWIEDGWHGAFTYALNQAVGQPAVTYLEAVLGARKWLAGQGYDQTPQACGSPELLDRPFFL